MSEENVERVLEGLDAYNRRDLAAMLKAIHPDADWYPFTAQVEVTIPTTAMKASEAGGRTWTPPSMSLR